MFFIYFINIILLIANNINIIIAFLALIFSKV